MTARITIDPVAGLPEIVEGDDLAGLIAGLAHLRDGDVVVVAQKVVSKAEGALVRTSPSEASADARRRLAREYARRVVADVPWALIVETQHGFVCANAGIDASNAVDGTLLLLPEDPDASARRLRDGLSALAGVDVAVVITDTFGRPWRRGQTDVAIGVAGLAPLRDERGSLDRGGVALEVTEVAVGDEVAAAADLVRRKADGAAVVVVRGLEWQADPAAAARQLVRGAGEDLFPRGRGMLASALADPQPPSAEAEPLDPDDLAVARSAAAAAGAKLEESRGGAPTRLLVFGDRLAGGTVVAALLDLGCSATWRDDPEHGLVVEAGREPVRRR